MCASFRLLHYGHMRACPFLPSSIPGQLNDGSDDEFRRCPDQARDDIEVNTHLGTKHWNKEQ